MGFLDSYFILPIHRLLAKRVEILILFWFSFRLCVWSTLFEWLLLYLLDELVAFTILEVRLLLQILFLDPEVYISHSKTIYFTLQVFNHLHRLNQLADHVLLSFSIYRLVHFILYFFHIYFFLLSSNLVKGIVNIGFLDVWEVVFFRGGFLGFGDKPLIFILVKFGLHFIKLLLEDIEGLLVSD